MTIKSVNIPIFLVKWVTFSYDKNANTFWDFGGIGRRAGLKNQIDFITLKYTNL